MGENPIRQSTEAWKPLFLNRNKVPSGAPAVQSNYQMRPITEDRQAYISA
jgi:hypothetical protein